MATSFTLLIVGLYLSLTIIYNGGTETMDSQLFASLITVGAAMAGSIIADIVVIRKENSNSELLSKEHDGLSMEHDSLSKEHDSLSKEHEDLSREHENLNNNLLQKHAEIMADLKDVRDYTIRTESARDEARRNGVDVKNVMAQIQALADANKDSAARLKEMQKDIDSYRKTLELRSRLIEENDRQIEELKKQNNSLKKENELLKNTIHTLNTQNQTGRDEEDLEY